jgi:hypothetical protein
VDVHLQDLRRRAGASGNVQDQAALLRARVRAGELAQELLELAAFCGSEAARLVVDPGHQVGTYFHLPPTPDRPHGIHGDGVRFDEFVADLSRWADVPGGVLVRASIVAARVALRAEFDRAVRIEVADEPFTSAWDILTPEARPRYMTAELRRAAAALTAAEAWLACPCEEHEEAWIVASHHPGTDTPNVPDWLPCGHARKGGTIPFAAVRAGEAPVRTAIRDALVAFALGASRA